MPRRRSRRRLRRTNQPTTPIRQAAKYIGNSLSAYGGLREGAKAVMQMKSLAKQIKSEVRKQKSPLRKKILPDWQALPDNGLKYHIVNINYKSSKWGKATQKLSMPGKTYEILASGNSSGQGLQNNATVVDTNAANWQGLYTALNNEVAVTALQTGRKLYLGNQKHEIEFCNVGAATCEMDIYFLIDKVTQLGVTDANTVWSNGVAQDSNTATAPAENTGTPWLDPRDTKLFRLNYWIRRIPCVLTPGERCKLTINFNPKRLIDYQYIYNYNQIRGLTHKIFMVQRGTLGDGTQTLAVTPASQTLTPSKIVWLHKRTMNGSILATLPRVIKQLGTNLPALAAVWHLDEDTGEPENTLLATEYA